MSDREFENYLALLGGMLRLRRTQRESIAGELRDHLIEHVAQLEASGSTHEDAVRRALEEFGDAAALAANFSALVGLRRRRLIMRCTIGTTVVMTGLVVAMLAFRPEVVDDPNRAQAQAESGRGNDKQTDGKPKGTEKDRHSPSSYGPRDARTRELLKESTTVEFMEVPIVVALETLADMHNVQYYIDNRSFRDANVDPDAGVSLNLDGVPIDMVLELMLRELGLGYRIRNGVIMIASEADLQSQTEVRVYRVPDGMEMAEELAALIPATIDDQRWREHVVAVDAGGRRRSGYGAAAAGYGGVGDRYGGAAVESAEAVIGGPAGVGTIRVFRGTLVISQTPEVHQKIEKLLADLERAGAMEPKRRADGPREIDPRGYGGVGGGSSDRSGYGRAAPAPSPDRKQPHDPRPGSPLADPNPFDPASASPFGSPPPSPSTTDPAAETPAPTAIPDDS